MRGRGSGGRRAVGRAALLAALVVALLWVPAAHAGGPLPGEAAGSGEGDGWFRAAARWVNLGLLLGLLWWLVVAPPPFVRATFSFPGLGVVLAERRRSILEARELARRRRDEAAVRLRESGERLARLEEEIAGLLEQARADAARELARAEEEGRAQARRVLELTQRELRAETLSAQRQLRAFVAGLAVGMAERLIRAELTAADHERLVRRYLSRLPERAA